MDSQSVPVAGGPDAGGDAARVSDAADVLRGRLAAVPRVALVLGSGLRALADAVEVTHRVPFEALPGLPPASVTGHVSEFVAGTLDGVPVVVQRGRLHLYEGHRIADVVLPVRALAAAGVTTLVLTNAAGGIRRTMTPPTLMLIADHLNLMFRSPLAGTPLDGEHRFPDMSSPYDAELRRVARAVARREGITLHDGVYAGVLGPSFETPAEIRMLDRLGADAVGMSTVPEAIVARARGMRVLGISSITNAAAGLGGPLDHDEVLAAGAAVADDLGRLVRGIVADAFAA